MKNIPLTNFQLISYFLPGFVIVFCLFLALEPISNFSDIVDCMKDLNIGFLIASLIISFVFGVSIDAIRNGFIEARIIDCIERKIHPNNKMDWSFYYKGSKEDVGLLYARYFTYYCFDGNMILALLISLAILFKYSVLVNCWLAVGTIIVCVFLFCDAHSLRKDMVNVTHYSK
jgi:hypothetical protein